MGHFRQPKGLKEGKTMGSLYDNSKKITGPNFTSMRLWRMAQPKTDPWMIQCDTINGDTIPYDTIHDDSIPYDAG